jgi:hypothetical protein
MFIYFILFFRIVMQSYSMRAARALMRDKKEIDLDQEMIKRRSGIMCRDILQSMRPVMRKIQVASSYL